MKVSIITATYNSAGTLADAMASVLGQTYPDIEYLIVDGASTDHTVALVQRFQEQHHNIKYISEPDKGIYDALNKGIGMATGEVLGFVHADDMLANNHIIADIVAAFKIYGCHGLYGDLHYVHAQNPAKVIRNWRSRPFKRPLLKRGWMPAHPTLYIKTSLYRTYGVFDTSYRIAADYEFVLRIFKQPQLQFRYIPENIVNMRTGGASNRSFQNIMLKSKEDYRALKQHLFPMPWLILARKNFSKLPQFFG